MGIKWEEFKKEIKAENDTLPSLSEIKVNDVKYELKDTKAREDLANLSIAVEGKQDRLTAGDNITIEGNVISASGGSGSWGSITGNIENQTDLINKLKSYSRTIIIDDLTTTLADLKDIVDEVNENGEHVIFDLSAFSDKAYVCLVSIDSTSVRINDLINVASAGVAYDGTMLLSDLMRLSKPYVALQSLTISCVDEDGEQIPSTTIRIYDSNSGSLINTYDYEGTPIIASVPYGFTYKINVADVDGYVQPHDIKGVATTDQSIIFTYMTGVLYGFRIDGDEANPFAKVSYLEDNANFAPAYMDFENDTFVWGDWENAFFMPKPCMLKYDGTVAYYLNPNDYTLKEDGTVSDIADQNFEGNAMMEWGKNGYKIWYKIVPDTDDDTSANVYISNKQLDDEFVAWSFYNCDDEMIDHFYTPIYNGSGISNKLRSLSGRNCLATSGTNEITYAKANNTTAKNEWYTEVLADNILITLLVVLMGKSTNVQETFGAGRSNGVQSTIQTGTMNNKGLFWGSTDTSVGVKVFGMENFWGNQWRRYAGHILLNSSHYYKLTYGTADGSEAGMYNTTAEGYIAGGFTNQGSSGGSIAKAKFISKVGLFGNITTGGSTSTNYCDGLYYNNSGTMYACRGGNSDDGLLCGLFAVVLNNAVSNSNWRLGASVSCKPLTR